MIEVRKVSHQYSQVKALDGIEFQSNMGETYTILGENGSGKSSLFKCLTSEITPTHGQIFLDGKPVVTKKSRRNIYNEVGYCSQDNQLISFMTVYQQLMVVCNLKAIA